MDLISALKEIAALDGQTIYRQSGRFDEGAAEAFAQCARIAKSAIWAIERDAEKAAIEKCAKICEHYGSTYFAEKIRKTFT